jgi:hypothetical protein
LFYLHTPIEYDIFYLLAIPLWCNKQYQRYCLDFFAVKWYNRLDMWEGLVRAPRGRLSTRNLLLLLITLLVTVFTHLLIYTAPAHAADAFWKDGSIIYANNTYAKAVATANDGLGLTAGAEYYIYTEPITGTTARNAFILYFSSGTSPPQATSATYKTFVTNNGTFTQGSTEQTISIQPSADATTGQPLGAGQLNSCSIQGGLGWIICPASRWVANTMDYVYGVISDFLEVKPLQTTQTGTLYAAWGLARNIANVSFIIGFLVVIYAQVTGGLLTNYTLKKLLPRAVIVAILINISYWLCAVAVDISNVLGYSVQDLFNSIRESIAATPMEPATWSNVTEILLTGTTVGVAGYAGYAAFIAASGGTLAGSVYLLLMVMVSVIFAALVALIILAMRQALITIFIILAPLAFVLYLLPNTEKWFDRWKDTFMTMMLMFPIFSVLFGGAQLAGTIIIQNAKSPAVAILGLAVQVAPLVVTPMIVKLSGSLLGRIAGMINNPSKGLLDRSKNALKERADYHAARGRADAADRINRNGKRKRDFFRPTQAAYRHERAKMKREEWKKGFEERTAQLIHDDERFQRGRRESYNPKDAGFKQRQELDVYKRDTDAYHKRTEAKHEKHWNDLLDPHGKHFDGERFAVKAQTHSYEQGAKAAAEGINATLREFDAGVNNITIAKLGAHTKGSNADKQKIVDALSQIATETEGFERRIFVEGERKKSADLKIQGQIANAIQENTLDIDGIKIRDYAGGISGQAGANRVYAEARAKGVAAYMEEVKNSRSILSDHSVIELLDMAIKGKRRGGGTATGAEVDAAIQEILLTKGNNWSVQKLKDHIASQGMHYDETSNKFYEDKAKKHEIQNAEVIESRRTRQQIFVDAYNQSKHKVANLSGTDRGQLETGTFTLSSTDTILRDIRDQKINATRLAGTDIDELMRMVQVLRDDGARTQLRAQSPKAFDSLIKTINFALTDPQVSANIAEREQKMMQVIKMYAEDTRTSIPTADKRAYEATSETPVPSTYTNDHFYGVADKYGGTEPTGPR